jgi:ATP-dependent protease Clp ATPase subunit
VLRRIRVAGILVAAVALLYVWSGVLPAVLYLDSIRRMMEAHGKTLAVSAAALSALAQTGFSVKYGARFLKRTIDEKVKMPVTLKWRESDHFLVEEVGGEPVVITQTVPV